MYLPESLEKIYSIFGIKVLNLPTYCRNHKELNIRVVRCKVAKNGCILLHRNFVKTGVKSQHENSRERERERES